MRRLACSPENQSFACRGIEYLVTVLTVKKSFLAFSLICILFFPATAAFARTVILEMGPPQLMPNSLGNVDELGLGTSTASILNPNQSVIPSVAGPSSGQLDLSASAGLSPLAAGNPTAIGPVLNAPALPVPEGGSSFLLLASGLVAIVTARRLILA